MSHTSPLEDTIIDIIEKAGGKTTAGEILTALNQSTTTAEYDKFSLFDKLDNMRRKKLVTLRGVRVMLEPLPQRS